MEVNKISPVNNNNGVKKSSPVPKKPDAEQKTVAASAQEAAGNYGRAMLNIRPVSFGAQKTAEIPDSTSKIVVRDLSDEEFEEYKAKIEAKIKTLPEEIQNSINPVILNKNNIFIADKILSEERLFGNEDFMKKTARIINSTNSPEAADSKIKVIDIILSDKKIMNNQTFLQNACNIIANTKTQAQAKLAERILSDERLFGNENLMIFADYIISDTNSDEAADSKIKVIDKILSYERLGGNKDFIAEIRGIILQTDSDEAADSKIKVIDKIFSDEKITNNKTKLENAIFLIANTKTPRHVKLAERILSDARLYGNQNFMDRICEIIQNTDSDEAADSKIKLIDKILSDKRLCDNEKFMERAGFIIEKTNSDEAADSKIKVIDKILSDERLFGNEDFMKEAGTIIITTSSDEAADSKIKVIDKILSDEKLFSNKALINDLPNILVQANNFPEEELNNALSMVKKSEFAGNQVLLLIQIDGKISTKELQKLNKTIGISNAEKLNANDTFTAAKFVDFYGKQNINEIPHDAKRNLLRSLVSANADLFNKSEELQKLFPMLPKNREEYCSLLPSLVRSLGIETNTLEQTRVEEFNSDMTNLSSSLAALSDEEFNALDFKQEYDKKDFIADVLETVKPLTGNERQKVYDYFGFELHHNKNAEYKTEKGTGYSLTGYPVNLNNGKKLAQIEDEKTKEVVEKLRPLVVKFSENNRFTSGNEAIDNEVNKILDVLPELRSAIGREQHATQDFGVFKHSLKVMQKIAQNPEFEKLNEPDKKLMLLASLLHDITKKEGARDRTHAETGSFDSFFIAKKFNLTQDEENKLYTLIKNHEWLGYVNTAKDEATRTKRLQSVSYDFRHDNTFDMALMFTHADLKAVKKDDSFHDRTDGPSRTDFNGEVRSFGESADFFAEKIKANITELQKSQPLLPITKFPKAGTIDKAITTVNSDGSTNIKGIYKDEKGLTIIKFNEVEDWEAIGFPKGTVSNGIKTTTDANEEVDTGNIHFLVHGLAYSNQLAKFDAFSLVDSDALLSLSYAERPESKYRFFRPQGILLDCDTKYIHGGGETDAGSGCGKNIQDFKNNYIFGGKRESDRLYISNLIKETLNLNDEEYIKFVKENENKAFSEIEPEEVRNKVIKAFAQINSNTRKGKREYNEMYASNTKPPMAVFAYDTDYSRKIGNPVEFLNNDTPGLYDTGFGVGNSGNISVKERTGFLQQYALEHDIPFVVFGD